MEGIVCKHLTKGGVKVEKITTPTRGDQLTISIKNILVIIWLSRIHDKLVDCIRIEFASELRGDKQLIELMPRIADNVDNILSRHDITSNVALLHHRDPEEAEANEHDIRRINGPPFQRNRGGPTNSRGGGYSARGRRRDDTGAQRYPALGKVLNCSHCAYLSKTLRLKINTQHEPTECFRKDVVLRLTTFEPAEDNYSTAEDDYGLKVCAINTSSNSSSRLQIERPPVHHKSSQQRSSETRSLLRTEASPTQAKSPALKVTLHNHLAIATLDEGAEVSAISLKFCKQTNTEIAETDHTARAADSSKLRVVGRTKNHIILLAQPGNIPINLGHILVVDQLNADILIGEPGKGANNIVTVAADKKIFITCNKQEYMLDYHKSRGPVAHVARVETTATIYPGKGLTWPVPEQCKEFSHLFFQPRSGAHPWFEPNVEQIQEGNIILKNTSHEPVTLKRGKVFANIRMVDILDPERVSAQLREEKNIPVKAVFSQYPDQQQCKSSPPHKQPQVDHTSKIQLDPNNILSPSQVAETRRLCQEFQDVIRPEPGLYNGHYGHIDNKLEFKDKPPPTTRIHLQQSLSEDIKRILGEKMDQLHDWGVLQYPEHVGVRPVVVSPSMIVPKAEPNQYRLVTNTAYLNTFLRQPPIADNPGSQGLLGH